MNKKKMKEILSAKVEQWFNLETAEEPKQPLTLKLYSVIGGSWWTLGDTAKSVTDQIDAADPSEITVRINSPGGSVTEGLTIYNYLRAKSAAGVPVTVVIDGMAASIASVIAQAGDKIVMNKAAFFHLHRPWCLACGNAPELRGAASDLDTVGDTIAQVYADRSKMSIEEITELLKGEEGKDGTMLNSSSALVHGLVDEIDETGAAAAACVGVDFFDLEEGEEKPEDDPAPAAPAEPEKPAEPAAPAAPAEPEKPEEPVNTGKLADDRLNKVEAELENLRARVMGEPAPAENMTWRKAVNSLGYAKAKQQYPGLYEEACKGR